MRTPPQTWYWHSVGTELGDIAFCVDAAGALKLLSFCRGAAPQAVAQRGAGRHSIEARDLPALARDIGAFVAGQRTAIDAAVAPEGTPFQRAVWSALQRIPWGQTRSYGELAAAIGRPGAARAVGRANGSNPIALAIPCHRVIGANGTLTGFAAGLDIKQRLLATERMHSPQPHQTAFGPTAPK